MLLISKFPISQFPTQNNPYIYAAAAAAAPRGAPTVVVTLLTSVAVLVTPLLTVRVTVVLAGPRVIRHEQADEMALGPRPSEMLIPPPGRPSEMLSCGERLSAVPHVAS